MSDFEKWKRRRDELRSERDRLQGKVDAAMDELKRLGYDSVDAAQTALDKLQKEEKDLAKSLDEMEAEFDAEFGALCR